MNNVEERLKELELRFTEQQNWIDELNQVVREQGDKLLHLSQELKSLREHLSDGILNEPPPHY